MVTQATASIRAISSQIASRNMRLINDSDIARNGANILKQ